MLMGTAWPLSSSAQTDGMVRLDPGPLVAAIERVGDALSRPVVLGHGVEGVLRAPMKGESGAVLDALAARFELSIHDDGTTLFVDSEHRELVRFVALAPDAMRRVRIALEGVPPVDGLRVHLVEAGVLLAGDRRHVDALERALQVETRRAAGESVSGVPGPPDAPPDAAPPSGASSRLSAPADEPPPTASSASVSSPAPAADPPATPPVPAQRPDAPPTATDARSGGSASGNPAAPVEPEPGTAAPRTRAEPPRDIESIPGFGDELPR